MMYKPSLDQIDPTQFDFDRREFQAAARRISEWNLESIALPERPGKDLVATLQWVSKLKPELGVVVLASLYYDSQVAAIAVGSS